jgi:hypothetical protein
MDSVIILLFLLPLIDPVNLLFKLSTHSHVINTQFCPICVNKRVNQHFVISILQAYWVK